jgi:hypothetical protein
MKLDELFPLKVVASLAAREDRRGSFYRQTRQAGLTAEWLRATEPAEFHHDPRGYENARRRAVSLTIVKAINRALEVDATALLYFEDDAVFHPDFRRRVAAIELPDNWGLFNLGCQHIETPTWVSRSLVRTSRSLDNQAVGIHSRCFGDVVSVLEDPKHPDRYCDVRISSLHKFIPTYACYPNLVWQAESYSDVAGRVYSNYGRDGSQQLFKTVLPPGAAR